MVPYDIKVCYEMNYLIKTFPMHNKKHTFNLKTQFYIKIWMKCVI